MAAESILDTQSRNNAVLVLTQHNRARNTSVPAKHEREIVRAYVYGGIYVVEPKVMEAFEKTTPAG